MEKVLAEALMYLLLCVYLVVLVFIGVQTWKERQEKKGKWYQVRYYIPHERTEKIRHIKAKNPWQVWRIVERTEQSEVILLEVEEE